MSKTMENLIKTDSIVTKDNYSEVQKEDLLYEDWLKQRMCQKEIDEYEWLEGIKVSKNINLNNIEYEKEG